MSEHSIIVIGASAGGVSALTRVVRPLPANLPAAIFVVLHIPANVPSMLASILNRATEMTVLQPVDRTPIEHGCIYVASPDRHLILEEGLIRVIKGPRENRHRPAIDPLFRSAALVYGPRVVGVVLTGALDDGTAGLLAVKQRGGLAIVQDPGEAIYPSMPESALEYVSVDACLPLAQISERLIQYIHQEVEDEAEYPITKELRMEVSIAKMEENQTDENRYGGKPSTFSCPECGGVLWELHDDKLMHFRCRVGHAFSPESIQAAQSDGLEEALWTALKTLEESVSFSQRMEKMAHEGGKQSTSLLFQKKAQEAEKKARIIRDALLSKVSGLETIIDEPESDQENGQRAL